jgi:hypothetical protein
MIKQFKKNKKSRKFDKLPLRCQNAAFPLYMHAAATYVTFSICVAVAVTLCTEGYWSICSILVTYFLELTVSE